MRTCAAVPVILLFAYWPVAYAGDNPIEMRWSELGPYIALRHIKTVLPDGTALEGRAMAVNPDALVVNVSKSSDKAAYPKGRTSIPRGSVRLISMRETRSALGRITMTVAGIFAVLVPLGYLVGAPDAGADNDAFGAIALGGVVAGGTGGYYLGRKIDRRTILIKVVPE